MDDAAGSKQTLIQRRAGERGEHGDLHIKRVRAPHKIMHVVEDFFAVGIQAENKTCIHRDAVRLNRSDRRFIFIKLLQLPVASPLKAVQAMMPVATSAAET